MPCKDTWNEHKGGSADVSKNHDNERLFRARSVPLSQRSQDSQRAQVVRGEQAALQGRRPGAVPASDHGPRAGAQRDRRGIHRRSESQWRLYDAYLSRHTVFERQEPLQDVRRGALLAGQGQRRGRSGILPSSGARQLSDRRRNLAARAQGAQKNSRQDRRRSQSVGPSDHGWCPWLNLPHGRRIAEAAASRLRPGSPVHRRHQAQGLRHQHSTDRPGSNRRRFPESGASETPRHRSFRAVLIECRRPALRCYGNTYNRSILTWRIQSRRSSATAVSLNWGSFGSLTTRSEYYFRQGTLRGDLMSSLLLPITLATAGALGLIGLILVFRVTMGRAKRKVNMEDGGNPDMILRMRTHANFVEYAPTIPRTRRGANPSRGAKPLDDYSNDPIMPSAGFAYRSASRSY